MPEPGGAAGASRIRAAAATLAVALFFAGVWTVFAQVGARSVFRGVVVGRTPSLSVLTEQGTVRTIVVTAATRVHGQGESPAEARVYDIVTVEGPANADGSVSAVRLSVEFAASSAARASGAIAHAVSDSAFVVGSTRVDLLPDTWVIQGTARRSVRDLAPGTRVAVFGVSPTGADAGGRPAVITARLIVITR